MSSQKSHALNKPSYITKGLVFTIFLGKNTKKILGINDI